MPKVSVIVPIYNVEKYLARCLESLINQTLEDIEIICVNDGSTDNSADILTKFAEKDERIKVITQVNSGLSEARNAGISASTGKFIAFLDSDDFVDLDFYEALYNSAIKNNCDIACGNIIRENNKKKRKPFINYDKECIASSVKDKYVLTKVPEHCYVWNKIYRRENLINSGVRFIRGITYEDMPFTADVLEKLGNLVCVPKVFYHYWINDESIVKTPTDKNRADKLFVKKYVVEKCRKYNLKLREKDNLICKREYYLFGLKVLKVYQYRATKTYSLFGLLPILTCKERV